MDLSIISKIILIACNIIFQVKFTCHHISSGKMAVLFVDLVIHVHVYVANLFGGYHHNALMQLRSNL